MSKKAVNQMATEAKELLSLAESLGQKVILFGKTMFSHKEKKPKFFIDLAKEENILSNLNKTVIILEKLAQGINIITEPIKKNTVMIKKEEDEFVFRQGTSTVEKIGKDSWRITETKWDDEK